MKINRALLPKQVRYWSLHCLVNALPSFLIAGIFLGLFAEPVAIAAMLTAMASFILLYTLLTSINGLFTDRDSMLARALKIGTSCRLVISMISVPLALVGGFMILPDFWVGWLSWGIVEEVFRNLIPHTGYVIHDSRVLELPVEHGGALVMFTRVYLATLIEGFLLSLMLMLFALIGLGVLRFRKRPLPSSSSLS